ncbi:UDP-glucuronic acid decarboxylase 1 [Gonapodya sp. JEL0774]|nr:UDP-glucuronic acid decarboxylase 1 [Gonapodya sp. JEL0774]
MRFVLAFSAIAITYFIFATYTTDSATAAVSGSRYGPGSASGGVKWAVSTEDALGGGGTTETGGDTVVAIDNGGKPHLRPPPAAVAPKPSPPAAKPLPNQPLKTSSVTSVGEARFGSDFPLSLIRQLYIPSNPSAKGDTGFVGNLTAIYAAVRKLPNSQRKRVLVTGGAGFVGSHLVDRLMLMGHEVIVVDNLFTGSKRNIQHWLGHPHFEFVRHDVVDPYMAEVDHIYHLACPASPPHYQYNPVKTVKTSVMGSINMLGLAKRVKARYLLTSTSEVYGDPLEHPQLETYWGHVNPIGPRACYDEGKRVAETLSYSYQKQSHVDVRVARIFNTFGPRMNENDGRVVSNFILQALRGKDITIYGDGSQTRSFQYVHDLVDGLIALMHGNFTDPVNLGNPEEFTIQNFAEIVRQIVGQDGVNIVNLDATQDDPHQRRPDITRAKKEIGWEPKFSMKQGIEETDSFPMSHPEALLLLEKGKDRLQLAGEVSQTGGKTTDAFNKSLVYAKRFAKFIGRDSVQEIKQIFPVLRPGQPLDDNGFHSFEVAELMNLCPETTEEAKSWIPTLERFGDIDLRSYLDELNALRQRMQI